MVQYFLIKKQNKLFVKMSFICKTHLGYFLELLQ